MIQVLCCLHSVIFKLPKLSLRRKQTRFILKALVRKATISLQDFHHLYRINCHNHPHTFSQLKNRFYFLYKNTFVPHTIVASNALPTETFGDPGISAEHLERFTHFIRNQIFKYLAIVWWNNVIRHIISKHKYQVIICTQRLKEKKIKSKLY